MNPILNKMPGISMIPRQKATWTDPTLKIQHAEHHGIVDEIGDDYVTVRLGGMTYTCDNLVFSESGLSELLSAGDQVKLIQADGVNTFIPVTHPFKPAFKRSLKSIKKTCPAAATMLYFMRNNTKTFKYKIGTVTTVIDDDFVAVRKRDGSTREMQIWRSKAYGKDDFVVGDECIVACASEGQEVALGRGSEAVRQTIIAPYWNGSIGYANNYNRPLPPLQDDEYNLTIMTAGISGLVTGSSRLAPSIYDGTCDTSQAPAAADYPLVSSNGTPYYNPAVHYNLSFPSSTVKMVQGFSRISPTTIAEYEIRERYDAELGHNVFYLATDENERSVFTLYVFETDDTVSEFDSIRLVHNGELLGDPLESPYIIRPAARIIDLECIGKQSYPIPTPAFKQNGTLLYCDSPAVTVQTAQVWQGVYEGREVFETRSHMLLSWAMKYVSWTLYIEESEDEI